MRKGDVIRGYRIVSEPTNNGGGKCVWAFAEKNGHEYFIKRFLEPKRPRPNSAASETSKRLRLAECAEFEERHRSIMKRLKPDVSGAGNLVLATDFFHDGSTYYKVTERIEISSLEQPQSLDPVKKCVLLRTLGLSLRLLHEIKVVHGDLKPENVLVQKKAGNTYYTAKLIDFDDAYLAGRPPARDAIAGDTLFGAPEWRRYLQDDEDVRPEFLTTSVDMFALGLMTHYYLTGNLPGYDDKYGAPADAVNAGTGLRMDDRLTDHMQGLIRAMTARAPGARPRIGALINGLKDSKVCELRRRQRARPGTAATKDGAKGSRLRTNLADTTAAADPPADRDRPRKSRVRINLGDRHG